MQNRNIKIQGILGGGISSNVFDCHNIFEKIISLENLFSAWHEFKKGKTSKLDVRQFEFNLEDNIFSLYSELKDKTYQHSNYRSFYIKDPKLRKIHKAIIKDRVLHHAIFRILYFIFDKSFIFDSYSCRNKKGTHRAVNRLNQFAKKVSKNHTKTCYVLKCDIKKFFNSIDQKILLELVKNKIKDKNTILLIGATIKSFLTSAGKGIPLGNITSQLFANVYLNKFDQFVKHILKEKHYIRYCDDFVILSENKKHLENIIPKIDDFLQNNLKLILHPKKLEIRKFNKGIDFLGYVSFSHYKILRAKTKNRILNRVKEISKIETLNSFLGMLKHCNSFGLKMILLKTYFSIEKIFTSEKK